MVISQPGKGYFISDHITKVFVFLDTFKAYKEVLYDSFFHALPKNVIADVNFHHYNPKLFKKLIEDRVAGQIPRRENTNPSAKAVPAEGFLARML